MPAYPILCMDAATSHGSVALFHSPHNCVERQAPMGASADDALLPAIMDACAQMNVSPREIRTVVCGAGPGSFTSLRIAASIAKGIARASGAGFHAVPSLLLAAASSPRSGKLLVHSDAMRGERFALAVEIGEQGVRAVGDPERISREQLVERARQLDATLVSVGSAAVEGDMVITPSAAQLHRVAEWSGWSAVPLASWEPQYGRLAEAQVKWEAAHGQPLPVR